MNTAIHDLLGGYLRHNLGPGYSATLYFSQIKSYVQSGYFTYKEYNLFMHKLNRSLKDGSIFKKTNYQNEEFIEKLRAVQSDTGIVKIYQDAREGMEDLDELAAFYRDVFYLFKL